MKVGSMFPSSYLKADDLQGHRVSVVIEKVTQETVGQGDDQSSKPVVHFRGKEKALVLNVTNANRISEVLGTDETDEWLGKEIKLFPTKTEFGGKLVPCIRVEIPEQTPATDDDSVPF